MAVEEDYEAYERWFPEWRRTVTVKKVVMCSPNGQQLIYAGNLFPSAHIAAAGRSLWDLNYACPYRPVDLIVACNVFHYSPDPGKWFGNVFQACRYFWMQDLFSRPRGPNGEEFGSDGDCMRYGLSGVSTNRPSVYYDLSPYSHRLLDLRYYDGGSFKAKKPCIHFVACFKGDVE